MFVFNTPPCSMQEWRLTSASRIGSAVRASSMPIPPSISLSLPLLAASPSVSLSLSEMRVPRWHGHRYRDDGSHGAANEAGLRKPTSRCRVRARSLPTSPAGLWNYDPLAPPAHRRYRRVVPPGIAILDEVLELLERADTLAENFQTIDAEIYELEEEVRAEWARFPELSQNLPKAAPKGFV